MEQGGSTVVCHGGGHWKSFRPASGAIHDGEEEPVTVGEGKGPTISTFTCVKRLCGTGICFTGVLVWREIFPLLQSKHCLAQVETSLESPAHTNLEETILLELRTPGCEGLWTKSKIWRRSWRGTSGRRKPVELSQSTSEPSKGTLFNSNLAKLIWAKSGQVDCNLARVE